MITNFVFVQKMRKIIVTEILNKMSEGLSNSNSRPRKALIFSCVGGNFDFQPLLERKRSLKRSRIFSMNTFVELQKSGTFIFEA